MRSGWLTDLLDRLAGYAAEATAETAVRLAILRTAVARSRIDFVSGLPIHCDLPGNPDEAACRAFPVTLWCYGSVSSAG
jgi:hypothetical protein